MFKFDENGELIQESVTESMEYSADDLELDPEDNVLLFEAMLLDVMTPEEYNAYIESDECAEDLKNMYGITETLQTRVKLNVFDEIKRLAKIAVFTIARRKKHPKMAKLEKTWAKARKLEADLSKELGSEAIKVARNQYNSHKKAKANGTLKKAIAKKKNAAEGSTKGFFKYVK